MPENHYHVTHYHNDNHYHFYAPGDFEHVQAMKEMPKEEMEVDSDGVDTDDIDDDSML